MELDQYRHTFCLLTNAIWIQTFRTNDDILSSARNFH